jgi:DNA-binding FadR family transcriptional regulator
MLKSVGRRQVVDDVIAQLEERIADGTFAVGARLPTEPELMTLCGVGRSTVREAVRALAHTGVLEVRQGCGTFVRASQPVAGALEAQLRRSTIREVYEVRRLLELETARLAAARREPGDLVAMRTHLDARNAARAASDQAAFIAADVAFHETIARAAHNALLLELYRTFARTLRETFAVQLRDATFAVGDVSALHEALLDAITRRDADAAVHVTTQLLDRTTDRLDQPAS